MTHSAAHPPGQNVPRCPHGICCGAVVVREPLHVAAQLRYRISRIPVHAHRRSTRQPLLVPTDPTAGIAQRSSQLESRYSGLPFQASPLRDRPNKAVPPRTHRPIPTGHQRSRELISSTSQHSTWRWRSAEATPTLELTMRPPRRCCRTPPPACFRGRAMVESVRANRPEKPSPTLHQIPLVRASVSRCGACPSAAVLRQGRNLVQSAPAR